MTVTLVEKYNPAWPLRFEEIKAFLGEAIAKTSLRFEHVGSTSIPGMTAKPIIDIIIVIEPAQFEKTKSLLEELGYRDEGDLGIKDREAFKFHDEALKNSLPSHHLYVCPANSQSLNEQCAFREYLKTHKKDRERLNALKWELAEKFDNDRRLYIEGKDALVKEITRKALKYINR